MKVAILAPFEETVPPTKYGGTELVVYNLITELHRLGHDVTLFGIGQSQVPCRVVSIFDQPLRTTPPYSTDSQTRDRAKIVGMGKIISLLQKERFDIVHNHMGWRFNSLGYLMDFPFVSTLHGPGGSISQRMVHDTFPHQKFISISDNQRTSFPELDYVATVYNGIDVNLYPYKEKPDEDYLFFLARFSPEKGPKEAIEIAKKSGKKLKMAVKVDQVDTEFFNSCKPMLEEAHVELLGEISLEQKVLLLQNASALIAPIQWDEPFGLFVIEALACGTPVIGTNRGSFPELVTHGVDGFLGTTVDEMVEFVSQIHTIDRAVCRKKVEEKFTKEITAQKYLKVYESLLASSS